MIFSSSENISLLKKKLRSLCLRLKKPYKILYLWKVLKISLVYMPFFKEIPCVILGKHVWSYSSMKMLHDSRLTMSTHYWWYQTVQVIFRKIDKIYLSIEKNKIQIIDPISMGFFKPGLQELKRVHT